MLTVYLLVGRHVHSLSVGGQGMLTVYLYVGEVYVDTYHILSVGGGGMLTAKVPIRLLSSTLSISLVLDTSSMARLIYFISAACWKYLD